MCQGNTHVIRRELPYEAMLASGRTVWRVGDRIRIYRRAHGIGGIVSERDDEERTGDTSNGPDPPRDYAVDHYTRVLRDSFASRLERASDPNPEPVTITGWTAHEWHGRLPPRWCLSAPLPTTVSSETVRRRRRQ